MKNFLKFIIIFLIVYFIIVLIASNCEITKIKYTEPEQQDTIKNNIINPFLYPFYRNVIPLRNEL